VRYYGGPVSNYAPVRTLFDTFFNFFSDLLLEKHPLEPASTVPVLDLNLTETKTRTHMVVNNLTR